MTLRSGLAASQTHTVTDNDTAIAFGTGVVPVLATPHVITMLEAAAIDAVHPHIGEGMSTVSVRVQVEHISPTPVGMSVTAEATLERVEGRRLIFAVTARDERGLIAAGKVTRVIVDVERFMAKTRS